jgi:hypothetical protein
MALLWIDGFDGYAVSGGNPSAAMALRYGSIGGSSYFGIFAGHVSGYAVGVSNGLSDVYFVTPSLTTNPTLIAGCAFYFTSTGSTALIRFYDNAANGIYVYMSPTVPSTISIKSSTDAVLATYTNFLLALNTWYYVEVKTYCHATAGTVEVRVNGVTVLTLTGANTKAGVDNWNTAIMFDGIKNVYFDDVYVCDGSGSTLNDFLGLCRVFGLFPNSDTATEQWTPSVAGPHYALVDENPPNTTDYVSTNVQAATDLYKYPSLLGTATVLGVQVSTQMMLSSGVCAIVESPIVSNGVTETGPDTNFSSATYLDVRHISTTDPNTGLPWTISNLAAAEIGIKVM